MTPKTLLKGVNAAADSSSALGGFQRGDNRSAGSLCYEAVTQGGADSGEDALIAAAVPG